MLKVRSVEWVADSGLSPVPGRVRILDQTRLPAEVVYLETVNLEEIRRAITDLQVRGAPAIGIAAAMGVAAAAQESPAGTISALLADVDRAARLLAAARPTAVNLFWALQRMRHTARACTNPAECRTRLATEAMAIRDEDAAMCRAIGRHGASLLQDGDTVLTHCNAGALATAEFGTALAPVYTAQMQGKTVRVYADETRPLLQGSRLTAWELDQAGVDVTVICDSAAARVMQEDRVQAVLVGADRIAANGDTANKIGTYGLAVCARAHGIPFYVLAPTSTIDFQTAEGGAIPIEERSGDEITRGFGQITAPPGISTYAPAFDVTPAELITAIVCEKGIARPDFGASLKALSQTR